MTITYEYGGNLYVNTTNRCDCACVFCLRQNHSGGIYTDNLWLEREPNREEILEDILRRDLGSMDSSSFCGYGEPSYRLDDILWSAPGEAEAEDHDPHGHERHAALILGRTSYRNQREDRRPLRLAQRAHAGEVSERSRPAFGAPALAAMLDIRAESVKAGIRVFCGGSTCPLPRRRSEAAGRSLGMGARMRAYID
jgi:hypothetical protein